MNNEINRNNAAEEAKIVKRLSSVGIGGNILLSAFKLFAGIFGHSGAMISDAVHSLSDVFATLIAFIGVKLAGKKADERHPYGHDRFECVASIVLGLILAVTGIGIGYSGIKALASGDFSSIEVPSMLPLIAAVISIISKEFMYRYTMHYAKKLDSAAFTADAWHHRSDALSSIGALIGIAGARLGFPVMDPIASIVICLFILKVAYEITFGALQQMLDTSLSPSVEKEISDFISGQPGVENLDLLRTRQFGNKVYIDAEIAVDKYSSLIEAHDIAEAVHHAVEKKFPKVKHVMIHVNPGK